MVAADDAAVILDLDLDDGRGRDLGRIEDRDPFHRDATER